MSRLGYAATVHTAHGMTVDTSHTVLAGATTARRGATDPAARLHDAAPYLRGRAGLIAALAERVALDTAASEDTSGWTNGLTPRLHGELAVWRAAHGIADTDPEPTGRHHDDDRGAGISATLTAASDAALTGHRAHRSSGPTTSLPGFFATQARCGPGSPNCRRPGADVPALIRQALAEPRALPAEDPADALWWRIVGADFAGYEPVPHHRLSDRARFRRVTTGSRPCRSTCTHRSRLTRVAARPCTLNCRWGADGRYLGCHGGTAG